MSDTANERDPVRIWPFQPRQVPHPILEARIIRDGGREAERGAKALEGRGWGSHGGAIEMDNRMARCLQAMTKRVIGTKTLNHVRRVGGTQQFFDLRAFHRSDTLVLNAEG